MVQSCSRVFLEAYTSLLMDASVETLEKLYGKKIELADRDLVESGAEQILADAKESNVAFLVAGDPFCATTHFDLVTRARKAGIKVEVVHNASIMNAVGSCGLELYNFGQTVTICFFTETWKPDSFYDKIASNKAAGLHTLVLLDLKVKEQSEENLMRGRKIYEPPRFMTVNRAIEQMLEVEERRKQKVYTEDTKIIGMARVGGVKQLVAYGTMQRLLKFDFGSPLHCLIVPGNVQEVESEFLSAFAV
eukprot:TRINITY_DN9052_c0_g1_i1.p2 TRINITY_DN9052_c0_g1~~TRINITY_DN9052_c0_g1_i1.p2  ORF type:complete len:275 (-),score=92.93 TRINITY_DN9052_c0_g1_i1:55-798(-)